MNRTIWVKLSILKYKVLRKYKENKWLYYDESNLKNKDKNILLKGQFNIN